MYTMWNSMRSTLIVPVFRCLVALCLIISVLVSIESVYMNLVILYVKLFGRKPEKVYKWEEMQKDMELGHQNYPVILIQIPMYNEREVRNLPIPIYYFMTDIYIYNKLPSGSYQNPNVQRTRGS